jgi:hypothetical protein
MTNDLKLPADQSWAKIIQEIGRKELDNRPEIDDFELLKVTKEELIGTENHENRQTTN